MVCVYKICIIVDKLSVVWLCIVFDASVNKSFRIFAYNVPKLTISFLLMLTNKNAICPLNPHQLTASNRVKRF